MPEYNSSRDSVLNENPNKSDFSVIFVTEKQRKINIFSKYSNTASYILIFRKERMWNKSTAKLIILDEGWMTIARHYD